ncbi:MAG: twin-arginine translocase subunit TatC [Gemmataceae bacterium]
MSRQNEPDPEDMFADSRMSFGEHIEDLRTHLLRALWGFLIFFVASFFIAPYVLRYIGQPVEDVLMEYYRNEYKEKREEMTARAEATGVREVMPVNLMFRKRDLQDALGVAPSEKERKVLEDFLPGIREQFRRMGLEDWVEPKSSDPELVSFPVFVDKLKMSFDLQDSLLTINPPLLKTLSVQEAFVTYIWIAILTGLVLSSPWVFYQIWKFIAAGLYPHEKRYVHVYLPLSLTLFLAGVFICEFFVIPKAIEALLWFNKLIGMQPDMRLSEWLGFAIFMPLVFGVSFQTPIVMLFLERIGLVSVETYREKRKFAIFFLAVFAAVITPSTDIFSMEMLHIPMCLLYELGIIMCAWSPREKTFDGETEESEDLIEV